jgi:hypothetical protein
VNKPTHAPGPWFEGTGWIGQGIRGQSQRVICRIDGYPYGETEANARLIAAAPDLLEACKDLLTWHGPDTPQSVLDSARATIRKANGDT